MRGAQVTCVNAMMRYVRDAQGGAGAPGAAGVGAAPNAAPDLEAGQEVSEGEEELPPPTPNVPSAANALAAPTPTGGGAKKPAAPAPAFPRFIPAAPH